MSSLPLLSRNNGSGKGGVLVLHCVADLWMPLVPHTHRRPLHNVPPPFAIMGAHIRQFSNNPLYPYAYGKGYEKVRLMWVWGGHD